MQPSPESDAAAGVRLKAVSWEQPFDWLARGWRDMLRRPKPALAHGALVAGFGLVLLALAHDQFWLLAGAFSGFLLIGPIAATGLYAVSRALERGEEPTLATALAAWRPKDYRLVLFGLLLCAAGTGWVLTSASLIWSFAPNAVLDPADFLRVVVLADEGWLFEGWLALGGVLVAPVYASSVVSIPLLMERRIGVLPAVLVSWRAVLGNVGPMTLWGGLLMAVTFVGMVTAMLGLIVAVPWLSYASWHAYRDLVDASALPESG
ncbi:MAG: DUF2189 domain-containing protein [Burkholderiales bacterium]|nr:DUF2189 domain-containing protein [Burkholderiales bacterium]